MKHLFIINPAAGKKDSTEQLLGRITKLDADVELFLTGDAGDAQRRTEEAVATGEPMRIYACGGDGTLNEVVCGAAGHDHVAITNVPKGTGNDFLRIFGEGWREGFSDLEALLDGPQGAFDVIDCNGKLGIGVSCAGLDARIGDGVHKYKRLPAVKGMGAYILSLIEHVLFRGLCTPMHVKMGDWEYKGEVAIVCACSGRFYGGGFMPVGDAMPDDGILNFLAIPKISLLTFARLVKKYATGKYRDYPELIQSYQGQQVSISSHQEITAVVDGETVKAKELVIKLSDKKINFFYPAYLDYRNPQ